MEDLKKELFDTVNKIGEGIFINIHIVDRTELWPDELEKKYRIYHSKGFCLDVIKEVSDFSDDGDISEYQHEIEQDYEGFKRAEISDLYEILHFLKSIKHEGI